MSISINDSGKTGGRDGRYKLASLALVAASVLSACAGAATPAPSATQQSGQGAATQAPAATQGPDASSDPYTIGVSGPLTGPSSQYGVQWKKGFDLALDEINAKGGIKGHKLQYVFEDSQNDPKQTVAIAQKFIADPRILIELGDFSSPASMAASSIYQRAGLVQFGFTNSHPDFTKGGDYTWSNSASQTEGAPNLANFAVKTVGLKKLSVFYLNTDWGKTTYNLFAARAKEIGAEIVSSETYLPEEKDFRSALTRVRDTNPDGIVLISYYGDAALILQARDAAGVKLPVVASGSAYSPKLLEIAGKAAEGVYIPGGDFTVQDPRPEVQAFVKAYRAKYNEDPESFAVYAYDTIYVVKAAIEQGGADRKGIKDALSQIKDVPSVIYGKVAFDPQTRRLQKTGETKLTPIQVIDGKYVTLVDGIKSASK